MPSPPKRKKTQSIDVNAAIKEALLRAPQETFTVPQAKKAVADMLFNDQNMTSLLANHTGRDGFLRARANGTFEIKSAFRNFEGSELKSTIIHVLCQETGNQDGLDGTTLADRVRDEVSFPDSLSDADVELVADSMSDSGEIRKSQGKYFCNRT